MRSSVILPLFWNNTCGKNLIALPAANITLITEVMRNNICFFTEDVNFTLPEPTPTTTWLQSVIQQEGYALRHLNFIFCSDHYLHEKNLAYLQHDTLTDVLTFDYTNAAGEIEGDIYISIDRVRENAKELGHTLMQELATVMVHGVLHLLGYKDQTAEEKVVMRQKEAEHVGQRHGYCAQLNEEHSCRKK